MRLLPLSLGSSAIFALIGGPQVAAEPYQEYLTRLRDICSVECLQPRDLQRTARKRNASDESDMAIIMDVAEVRRNGANFELLNLDLILSPLEDRELLGSAGINTSSSTGIGGLPRSYRSKISPRVVIIEIDEQTASDILNLASAQAGENPRTDKNIGTGTGAGKAEDGDIVVKGDPDRKVSKPSLTELRSYLRNRRIVVRGKPRLAAVLIGARRDFRQKQVTLELDDADRLAVLPRYDKKGGPMLDGEFTPRTNPAGRPDE